MQFAAGFGASVYAGIIAGVAAHVAQANTCYVLKEKFDYEGSYRALDLGDYRECNDPYASYTIGIFMFMFTAGAIMLAMALLYCIRRAH